MTTHVPAYLKGGATKAAEAIFGPLAEDRFVLPTLRAPINRGSLPVKKNVVAKNLIPVPPPPVTRVMPTQQIQAVSQSFNQLPNSYASIGLNTPATNVAASYFNNPVAFLQRGPAPTVQNLRDRSTISMRGFGFSNKKESSNMGYYKTLGDALSADTGYDSRSAQIDPATGQPANFRRFFQDSNGECVYHQDNGDYIPDVSDYAAGKDITQAEAIRDISDQYSDAFPQLTYSDTSANQTALRKSILDMNAVPLDSSGSPVQSAKQAQALAMMSPVAALPMQIASYVSSIDPMQFSAALQSLASQGVSTMPTSSLTVPGSVTSVVQSQPAQNLLEQISANPAYKMAAVAGASWLASSYVGKTPAIVLGFLLYTNFDQLVAGSKSTPTA